MKDEPDEGQAEAYSAEFKAKVAMEALRGELTVSQLATKHGVHQTMIGDWKRQAMEGLVSVFSGSADAPDRRAASGDALVWFSQDGPAPAPRRA